MPVAQRIETPTDLAPIPPAKSSLVVCDFCLAHSQRHVFKLVALLQQVGFEIVFTPETTLLTGNIPEYKPYVSLS